jgi:hypothetical protein
MFSWFGRPLAEATRGKQQQQKKEEPPRTGVATAIDPAEWERNQNQPPPSSKWFPWFYGTASTNVKTAEEAPATAPAPLAAAVVTNVAKEEKIPERPPAKTREDLERYLLSLLNTWENKDVEKFWNQSVRGNYFVGGVEVKTKDGVRVTPVVSSNLGSMVTRAHLHVKNEKNLKYQDKKTQPHNKHNFIDNLIKLAGDAHDMKSVVSCFFRNPVAPLMRTEQVHEFYGAVSRIDLEDIDGSYRRIQAWDNRYLQPFVVADMLRQLKV